MIDATPPVKAMFLQIVDEIVAMHNRKQADYGREGDPYANVRASENFGIEPWIGSMARANDKMLRLQAAARGSTLVNEGVEDSLIDIAVYSIIALVLYRERRETVVRTAPSGHGITHIGSELRSPIPFVDRCGRQPFGPETRCTLAKGHMEPHQTRESNEQ